jgi:hypothetical protein
MIAKGCEIAKGAIYKANLDMKGFHQEAMRVLLDSQLRCITKVEIAKGTVTSRTLK